MTHNDVLAGVAEREITPPMGIELCGYGPYLKRQCTEVLDPLYARALYLEVAAQKVVIVTVDIIAIPDAMRQKLAEQIEQILGVPATAVMINASHTHSGPATPALQGWGERDSAYLEALCRALVDTACRAGAAVEPVRLGFSRARVEGVGRNREQPLFGPLDTAAQLMRVEKMCGAPLALIVNFGAHPVIRYPFTSRVSADWPGLVTATLSNDFDGAQAMFLQGCLGNINGHDLSFDTRNPEQQQKMQDMRTGDTASRLTEQILPALRATDCGTTPVPAIGTYFGMLELPLERPSRSDLERKRDEHLPLAERFSLDELEPLFKRGPDDSEELREWRNARFVVDSTQQQLKLLEESDTTVKVPLQILRIGSSLMVNWPAEVFVELGIELRQRSPVEITFVNGMTNGAFGYIPTEAAYESQGKPHQFGTYPTRFTPGIYGMLPYRSSVGRILVEETLRRIYEMEGML